MTGHLTFKRWLPAHWASYLLNGDPSTFHFFTADGQAELDRVDDWCESNPGWCVSVGEAEFRHGSQDCEELAGDYAEFTFQEIG